MFSLQQIADEAWALIEHNDWELNICNECFKEPLCSDLALWFFHYTTNHKTRVITVPAPVTSDCLFIYLHEIGHAYLQDVETKKLMKLGIEGAMIQQRQRRRIEQQASEWAKKFMEDRGVLVSPEQWAVARDNWESFPLV